MRPLSLALTPLLLATLFLTGCSNETSSTSLALNDPDSLLDELTGPLRLLVVSGDSYACTEALGVVSPSPLLPAAADDLVVDITLDIVESETQVSASAEVSLAAGAWVVSVSGDIMDPESGSPARATGCTTVSLGLGETREASIMVKVEPEIGVCGDGIIDQTEQCDDGGVEPGDGCDAQCLAESSLVQNEGPDGSSQRSPSVVWSPGQRAVIAYQDMTRPIGIYARFLSPTASSITDPGFYRGPRELRRGANALGLESSQGGSRTVIVYTDVVPPTSPPPVGLITFEQTNNGSENYVGLDLPTEQMDCTEPRASVASSATGAALVLIECPSALVRVAVGADGVAGTAESFSNAAGEGIQQGVQIASVGDRFAYTFVSSAAASVGLQLLDGTGAPDGEAIALNGTADTGTAPRMASTGNGNILVTWQQSNKIRGQVVASGAPIADAFDISEGTGLSPSVSATETHFVIGYLNAPSPTDDGEARARYFDSMGQAVLHRGPDATTGSFALQAGDAFDLRVDTNENQALFVWRDRSSEPAGDISYVALPLP